MTLFDRPLSDRQAGRYRALKTPLLRVQGDCPQDDRIYRIEDFENGDNRVYQRDNLDAWLAAHWGLDPFLPSKELYFAVMFESARRKPCRNCRGPHRLSVDPYYCDGCFMRRKVKAIRDSELAAYFREVHRKRRKAAAVRMAQLSPGRRRFAELTGAHLNSPEEVFYAAYEEVPS